MIIALLAAPGFLAAQEQAVPRAVEADAEQREQLNTLRNEIMEINARLQAAQREALAEEEVREEQKEYEETLRQAMVEKKPEIAETVDQRDALAQELLRDPDLQKPAAERSEAFERRLQQYEALNAEVTTVADEVASEPEVEESRESFQRVLLLAMSRADPETPQLLRTREEKTGRFYQMMNEINRGQ